MKTNTTVDLTAYSKRFAEAGAVAAYAKLNDLGEISAGAKAFFLNGIDDCPHMAYPNIDDADLERRITLLQELKADLKNAGLADDILEAYHARIVEKIHEYAFLREVAGREKVSYDGDDVTYCQAYEHISVVYPLPKGYYWSNMVMHQILADAVNHPNAVIHHVAERFAKLKGDSLLTDDSSVEGPLKGPSTTLLAMVNEVVRKLAQPMLDIVDEYAYKAETSPESMTYDAKTFAAVANKCLATLGTDHGYEAEISENATLLSANHDRKKLIIPASRRMNYAEACEKVVHEIFVHIKKRIQGEKSAIPLLGLGLAGYEIGEEGITTVFEQAMSGKYDPLHKADRYIAIVLAMGDYGYPRDFEDVWKSMVYYHVWAQLKADDILAAESEAYFAEHDILDVEFVKRNRTHFIQRKNATSDTIEGRWNSILWKAWNNAYSNCFRTFRGFYPDTYEGDAFPKDAIYWLGAMQVWERLMELPIDKVPIEIENWMVGKYNPCNADHRNLLKQHNLITKI